MQIVGDRIMDTIFSRRRNPNMFLRDASMISVLCDNDTTIKNHPSAQFRARSSGLVVLGDQRSLCEGYEERKPSEQDRVVDRSPSGSPGMESVDSRISSHSRTSIWIEEDLRYLQQVTVEATIPFVPNIRYGKVLSIEDGRTFTVAARIFNGYTTVLSPHTYRFQLVLAGIEPLVDADIDPACDVLQHILVGHIVHIPHIDIDPTTGQLHAQIYIGEVHLNHWMVQQGLARSSLCRVINI